MSTIRHVCASRNFFIVNFLFFLLEDVERTFQNCRLNLELKLKWKKCGHCWWPPWPDFSRKSACANTSVIFFKDIKCITALLNLTEVTCITEQKSISRKNYWIKLHTAFDPFFSFSRLRLAPYTGIPGTIVCNVSEISIIYYVNITKIID